MSAFYAGIIHLRREDPRFEFMRTVVPETEVQADSVIAVTWRNEEQAIGYAIINPNSFNLTMDPPDGWKEYCIGVQGAEILPEETCEGVFTVAPRSVTIIAPVK